MSNLELDTSVNLSADWGMDVSDDYLPSSKSKQEEDAKGIAGVYCYDSIGAHPKAIQTTHTEETTGWSSKDVLQAASKSASTNTSWWQSTVNGIANWLGISSTEQSEGIEDVASTEGSWIDYLDPRTIISGATAMASSLWNTITFAEKAFEDPTVNTIEIPEKNPDGTANPFGGRRISRDDYKQLVQFHNDCQELLDQFSDITSDSELEAFVMALTKAIATDKEDEFDYQRTKLSTSYKDRDVDLKLRDKASKELIDKIRNNQWYGWFFDAASRSAFAFGGAALGIASGSWMWALPMITFSGIGVINSYIGYSIEKGAARLTALPSTYLLGGDYDKNVARHTDRWRSAHTILMWGLSASVFTMQAVTGGAQTITEAAFKAIMSLSGIAQNLAQTAKIWNYRQGQVGQAEFEYRQDKLKEHEKSISAGIKGLAKVYKNYTSSFKQGHGLLERASQAITGFFR